MAANVPQKSRGSFRVPNSIVQGLTTASTTGLNRLTSIQMVTLFGLMAHVSSRNPLNEVRVKVSDILEIIRVSRNVTHAVDRTWTTQSGKVRHRRYESVRYSPKHLTQVHDALLTLHNTSVAIHHFDRVTGRKVKDQIVHILDSFGYCYEFEGQNLDVDDLPPDRERVNIATDERPVWRVRFKAANGDRYERPTGITFRINRELAQEILKRKGTIQFTLFALRVFELFRQFTASPAAIRLLVLVLRQTQEEFIRLLTPMLDDLGFDATHPDRAVTQLGTLLGRLREVEVVTSFAIDRGHDRVKIAVNRAWYRGQEEGEF